MSILFKVTASESTRIGNESLLVPLALAGLAVVIGFVPEAISDRSWRWPQVMKFVSGRIMSRKKAQQMSS